LSCSHNLTLLAGGQKETAIVTIIDAKPRPHWPDPEPDEPESGDQG
jgi:hypothetical protein